MNAQTQLAYAKHIDAAMKTILAPKEQDEKRERQERIIKILANWEK